MARRTGSATRSTTRTSRARFESSRIGERFDLLEALATRVADVLMERFSPESLRLRVRKPQVEPAGMTVEYSAVTVERP